MANPEWIEDVRRDAVVRLTDRVVGAVLDGGMDRAEVSVVVARALANLQAGLKWDGAAGEWVKRNGQRKGVE